MTALKGLAALLFLNAALSFENWWPTPAIQPDHRLAPELLALWVVLLVVVKRAAVLPRAAATGFALVYLLLVIGRYADVTAPALFGRPINLYWDLGQIPRFLSVASQHFAAWELAATGLLVALALFQIILAANLTDSFLFPPLLLAFLIATVWTLIQHTLTQLGLAEISEPADGSWIHMVNPDLEELEQVQHAYNIPPDYLTYPLDQDEMAASGVPAEAVARYRRLCPMEENSAGLFRYCTQLRQQA